MPRRFALDEKVFHDGEPYRIIGYGGIPDVYAVCAEKNLGGGPSMLEHIPDSELVKSEA